MIKNLVCQLILATSLLLLSLNVLAEENSLPLVPLPSVIDYTKGDGWAGAIGLKLESLAVYSGSDHYVLELKPEGAIQWRKGNHLIFWEGLDLNSTEFGWRGLILDIWLMQAGIRHETVLPASRTEKANIDNFPHRGSHIIGFIEAKRSIDDDWENWASGRISAGPSNFGLLAEISAGHNFIRRLDNMEAELVIFSTFGSKDNINNYFGISESDSNASGLEQVNLDGGYRSTGLKLICRKHILTNIQIVAKAGVEFYNNNFRKSYIVRDTSETSSELAVVWKF